MRRIAAIAALGLVAACGGTVTVLGQPQGDESEMHKALRVSVTSFFSAYDRYDMTAATEWLDPRLAAACGGVAAWRRAYSEFRQAEGRTYLLDRILVTSQLPDKAQADIKYTSRSSASANAPDDHLTIGQDFALIEGRWVMSSDWTGVKRFCRRP